jgi:glycosyltransferase involved in cell wall biosynthesis
VAGLSSSPSRLPIVSIITPSFNQARYLEATIASVLGQNYPNIEHIVMDGGSTDGSVEIIRRHESRLAYWSSGPDNGQTDAIAKGFARAKGSVLAWLNSDDMLAPSAVRIVMDAFERHPQAGVVYGDRLEIDSRGNVTGVCRCPSWYGQMLRRNITLPQEATFFRRGAFDKAGGVNASLAFSMDFDLWCRLAKVTSFHHVPAFLGYFRRHDAAKSVVFTGKESQQALQYAHEHEEVYRRHFGKALPGPLAARWYRLLHQAMIAWERRGSAYQDEVRWLREVACKG